MARTVAMNLYYRSASLFKAFLVGQFPCRLMVRHVKGARLEFSIYGRVLV